MLGLPTRSARRPLIELLVEADSGDARARAALAQLLDSDPKARHHAAELDRMWTLLGKLPKPSFGEDAEPAPSSLRGWNDRLRPYLSQAVAACLTLAIVGTGVSVSVGDIPVKARPLVIESGRGDHKLARLPDGSTIELSGDTKVFIEYAEKRRTVRLARGEALFTVAHNPDRPFIVKAANGEVRALGTAFDVKLKRGAVLVTVAKGRVQVTASSRTTGNHYAVLGIGQQLTYRETSESGDMLSAPRSVDVSSVVDWRDGFLEYHGEPLSEVIEDVNRHAKQQIVLLAPEEENTPIYGTLRAGDVEGLASIIRDRASPNSSAPVVRIDPAKGK